MNNDKPGFKTGALLRLVMEEHGLDRKDISQLVSVEPDTVDRWLSGTNRLKGVSARKIASRFHLPNNFFDYSLSDMIKTGTQYLSDQSVVITPVSGARVIIELNPDDVRKLVHYAFDLAQDNARQSTDDDPPAPDDLPKN